ncbi:MAG TPA: biotin--[acetyl-CoA-carboxylase] ligase [Limnobacter sp.]|nr:biotin--[acetyl-CoA-carboxylase] ligase [Limnobacter sp.]
MLTQADVHWIELDSVDSTNDYLARAYLDGQAAGTTAVLAHAQTAGRGRAGRQWCAEPGSSLCLSLGVPVAGYHLPALPICTGVAIGRVLSQLNVPVRLKWPNDLLIDNRKLGGVLCESFQSPSGPVTVIGVGLNIRKVNMTAPTPGLDIACLADCLVEADLPDLHRLAGDLVNSILEVIDSARLHGTAAVFSEFAGRDAWLGKSVQLLDQGVVCMTGTAMGLDSSGAYLLDTAQGLRSVMAGDLSLRVCE